MVCCCLTPAKAFDPKDSYRPSAGYVPDAATAIKIAVAIWAPIYGASEIAKQKPFRAKLQDGIWTVTGSVPGRAVAGGAAVAQIAKSDGRILFVSHDR